MPVQFDFGGQALADYLKAVNHPVLACNMDTSKEPTLAGLVQNYTVLSRAGAKVRL